MYTRYILYPNWYTKYAKSKILYKISKLLHKISKLLHKISHLLCTQNIYTVPNLLYKIPDFAAQNTQITTTQNTQITTQNTQISTTQNIQRTVHTIQNGTWLFSHSSYRGILMHWTLDHESINFHTLQCNTQYSIYGHCPGTILTVQLQWNNVHYCGRDAVHFGLKNQHIYYLCTVGFKLNQTELTDYTGMQYLLRITRKGTKIPLFWAWSVLHLVS